MLKDGRTYYGEYLNNKRNGQGTIETPDGTRHVGTWCDGKLIETTEVYDKDGNLVEDS